MKVYIASGLGNAGEAQAVAEALKLDGWEVTYAWWEHGSVQADGPEKIREVAVAEVNGVCQADLVVAVLPGGRGTHVEIGIALGYMQRDDNDMEGPQAILIYGHGPEALATFPFEPGNYRNELERGGTHDNAGNVCAFYHHPDVRIVEKSRGLDGLRLEALRVWKGRA